ncbi:MAG: hypothetical protein FWF44_05830, partial [Defluviitaleaceae bacterium]|nr:hypothetical protein [Defluviitaleaceae bacterium]
ITSAATAIITSIIKQRGAAKSEGERWANVEAGVKRLDEKIDEMSMSIKENRQEQKEISEKVNQLNLSFERYKAAKG